MLRLPELITILQHENMLKKYHISKAAIFGSILHTDEPNDIDILVGEYSDYKELLAFKDELELITGKNVDLVIEKYADPIVLFRAKKELRYVV